MRTRLRLSACLALLLALAWIAPVAPSAAAAQTCGTTTRTGYSVTLCITAPAKGATVAGAVPVKASVSVQGAAPAVNGITYTVDGTYLLFDPQAPYAFTMHTYRFPVGAHVLGGSVALSGGATMSPVTVPLTFGASQPPAAPPPFTPRHGTTPPSGQSPVVAAAGDGASGLTAEKQVTDLMASWKPNLVLSLGDVYAQASPEEFSNWYGENGSYYNKFFNITNPSIGNHEYTSDPNARAYFSYWGNPPHYYSYTVGNWHFVSLDNTDEYGTPSTSQAQYQWLQSDLDEDTSPCTAVTYHRPVYSLDGDEAATDFLPYWQLLTAHHVTMVVNGHSHNYQRWVPLDGSGTPTASGTREFVVGTGGQWISPFTSTDPRLAAGFDTTATAWGALKLTLNPHGATYGFEDVSGNTEDYGALACGPDSTAPSAPGALHAAAVSGREVALSWHAATDDAGVQSYRVIRDGAQIATVRGDATTYEDTTVAASTTFTYTVLAVDAGGHVSADSNPSTTSTPAPAPTFVQAATNATGSRSLSMTIGLAQPVRSGDLLTGWFGQYDAEGQVKVSDDVNGSWTRAGGETFSSGGGDLALYYVSAARAAPSGVDLTVSAASPTYLSGSASEYWGTAAAPLANWTLGKGVGLSASTANTPATPAGSMVFQGLITGGSPGVVTPGSTNGIPYVIRAARAGDSVAAADVTATAAGAQRGSWSLASSTDWYVGMAVFRAPSTSDTTPPSTPTGVTATPTGATSVQVTWQGSTDNDAVAGYAVLRGGTEVGEVPGTATTYVDPTVAAGTEYSYSVVAFDAANNRSPQSDPATITTPTSSAAYVQGTVLSTGSRQTTTTGQLAASVSAGDLLVGWFGQYDSTGPVLVSDNVNGAWTRVPGTTFSSGNGDIALYYKENSTAAPGGLTVTVSAASATYLQGVVSQYSGVTPTGSLLSMASGHGYGTAVSTGPTADAPSGSLVVAAVMTGGAPGSTTPGSTNSVALTPRSRSASGGVAAADVLSAAPGPQAATFSLGTSTDWYALTATFRRNP